MLTLRSHPFPFLLHLEWIILGSVLVDVLLPQLHFAFFVPSNSIVVFCTVIIFGLQGLYIPMATQWQKYPYTFLSLLLLFTLSTSGGLPRLFFAPSLILIMRSCMMFRSWGRLTIIFLSFVFLWLRLSERFKSLPPLSSINPNELIIMIRWGFTLLYGICALFVLMTVDALIKERQNKQSLALAHEQLREYALRIENQATLEERNRIAREIHDSLGHHLTALNIQLETGIKLLSIDTDRAREFLVNAKTTGSETLNVVRQSVGKLRQDPLEGKSLEESIQILAQSFFSTVNVMPQCFIHLPMNLPKELQWVTLRVVQESLTNICKHAITNEVNLNVIIKISDINRNLTIEIIDNGKGFNIDHTASGFGLKGMRERVKAVGGIFQLFSRPGYGCRVFAQLPLPVSIYPIGGKE